MNEIDGFTAFTAGLARGEIEAPVCGQCRTRWFPAGPRCPGCGSDDVRLDSVGSRGTLYSWVVIHRSAIPELQDRVPYVVGIVDVPVTKGLVRVPAHIDADPAVLTIDAEVELVAGPSHGAVFRLDEVPRSE